MTTSIYVQGVTTTTVGNIMVKLYKCENHKVIENDFDIESDAINTNSKPVRFIKERREKYCKYCGLKRKPIYKDGKFKEYHFFET